MSSFLGLSGGCGNNCMEGAAFSAQYKNVIRDTPNRNGGSPNETPIQDDFMQSLEVGAERVRIVNMGYGTCGK